MITLVKVFEFDCYRTNVKYLLWGRGFEIGCVPNEDDGFSGPARGISNPAQITRSSVGSRSDSELVSGTIII